MSALIRLEPRDFLVSAESITSALWTDNQPTLTSFYTSSNQEAATSGDFHLDIYQTASSNISAEVQFAISYGNKQGSGSVWFNSSVDQYTPTRTVYGQYRSLVLGDENGNFVFGGVTSSDFWAVSIDRSRYKEKLLPGSLTLQIQGTGGTLSLTDNSTVTTTTAFGQAGRIFQIVSGSAGTVVDSYGNGGYSQNSGSYGYFLPDIGTLLLHPAAISSSIQLDAARNSNTDDNNNRKLYNALTSFRLNSEETVTSDYIYVRVRNDECNYSENPTYISGSTGEIVFSEFINNPKTFITTIGFYNDANELLAVAKLSKPTEKNFTREALYTIKLNF